MTVPKERRVYTRLPVRLDVQFTISSDPSGRTYRATSSDMSTAGMCLEVSEQVAEVAALLKDPNARVAAEITLPDNAVPLKADAEAVWSQGSVDWVQQPDGKDKALRVGLRFWGLPEDLAARIHQLMVDAFIQSGKQE
jgi:c-di-GMP-binding flagellar brake protein YcgR